MLAGFRSRISSAHLIAFAALVVALGGTAYSAATIDSRDVENNSIKSSDLKNDAAVKSADVKNESLGPDDLAPGSVGASEVADNALGGGDIDESSLSLGPTAAYAEVKPDGTIRSASGITQTQVKRIGGGTSPAYCINGSFQNAVASPGIIEGGGGFTKLTLISDETYDDLGVGSDLEAACGADVAYIVQLYDSRTPDTVAAGYFTILLH